MERLVGLVVVVGCLVVLASSEVRATEEAMSAVDLTEDTFKDKVLNLVQGLDGRKDVFTVEANSRDADLN
jgi:hypothetical protein